MIFEDAYEGPRPTGPDIIPRLVAELHAAEDGYTRGKFIELLGEMGDTSVAPELIAELEHPDQAVRNWAVTALDMIGGETASQASAQYKADHADEFV